MKTKLCFYYKLTSMMYIEPHPPKNIILKRKHFDVEHFKISYRMEKWQAMGKFNFSLSDIYCEMVFLLGETIKQTNEAWIVGKLLTISYVNVFFFALRVDLIRAPIEMWYFSPSMPKCIFHSNSEIYFWQ